VKKCILHGFQDIKALQITYHFWLWQDQQRYTKHTYKTKDQVDEPH
jgi:hypothetical protein